MLIIAIPKGEVVALVRLVSNVNYMDKHKENIINANAVYIYGAFDESIITLLPEIKKQIDTQKTLKDGKIIFHINSNGGQIRILQSLLNLVEYAKKENVIVETIVECNAFSCGSLLACSGTIGHRYISEYGEHLIHSARCWQHSSTLEQIDRNANYMKRVINNLKDIYKKYCTLTAKNGCVRNLLHHAFKDDNFYISAKDCIKYGLADKILNEK